MLRIFCEELHIIKSCMCMTVEEYSYTCCSKLTDYSCKHTLLDADEFTIKDMSFLSNMRDVQMCAEILFQLRYGQNIYKTLVFKYSTSHSFIIYKYGLFILKHIYK